MSAHISSLLVGVATICFAGAAIADAGNAGHAHQHGPAKFAAGEPGADAKVSRRIEIVAREGDGKMSFGPATVRVKRGENIEFVVRNDGQLEHEFVLGSVSENASHAKMMEAMPDMRHDDPNATRVAAGKSARLVWRFSRAGEFEFACLIPGHYVAGMKGAAFVAP